MKLQISMPGKRLTTDLPDETAERRFADFVSQLLFEELPEPIREEPRESPCAITAPATPAPQKTAYYMECPHCGKRTAFTWIGKLRYYECRHCQSSSEVDFDSLIKIDFACECGMQEMYLTNISEERFDMQCFSCRKMVPIHYGDETERFGVEGAHASPVD